jgi:beta-glucosidase
MFFSKPDILFSKPVSLSTLPSVFRLTVLCGLLISNALFAAVDKSEPKPFVGPTPWTNTKLNADARASLILKEMTQDEKLTLVFGHFGSEMPWKNIKKIKAAIPYSAGYVAGVPRLGIPALFETDAGMGVACQRGPKPRERTALASGLATAATWNLDMAYQGGAMIGSEARASGFNVLLGGGANLVREPRNGRNFEYAGEDPLLAGLMAAQHINGIQSQHVVSTLKHFAINSQETGRFFVNAVIDDASARMSDLLAFQIAVEQSNPGSVMCAYNRVNGFYSCESDYLLNQVLKGDWGYKGWVMSDWGATHSTVPAANNGLDQESGWGFDVSPYFSGALKEAVELGWVPQSRLDNMVHRILRSMFANGLFEHLPAVGVIDFKANAAVTQAGAEEAMVLLKNKSTLLPIRADVKKIAVIGGHANVGVLSGGGSSQVYPVGGMAIKGLGPKEFPGPMVYFPSSPLKAIKARASQAKVLYNDGMNVSAAAKLAATSDLVIVFANQWTAESIDAVSLSLPDNQDVLISAVASANKNVVVVLQTGGPVTMPWLDNVSAVLEAWYPGTRGGEAIARVLFGEVNPSGHLPVTFPASESQLPRPVLDGDPKNPELRFNAHYNEGAAVGYKWFDLKNLKPLFPFGYGLSYTQFEYSNLETQMRDGKITASFKVTNIGALKGKEVAQVYVSPVKGGWEAPKRLGAWQKLELNSGESKLVDIVIDSRLLGMFDSATKTWRIAAGDYKLVVAQDAGDAKGVSSVVNVKAGVLDVKGKNSL